MLLSNEVQHGEEENPHQVNQVPIQSDVFRQHMVVLVDRAVADLPRKPGEESKSDDDMDGMQSGEREVDTKEEASHSLHSACAVVQTRKNSFLKLVGISSVKMIISPSRVAPTNCSKFGW